MHFSQNFSNFLHRGQVQAHITEEMQPTFKYITLLVLSTFLAHLGLMASQPTVTLGAMLISPLMWPVLGLSLGIVSGRWRMIVHSSLVGLASIAFAIALSGLLTLAFDPAAMEVGETLRSHMSPTLFDMAIALLTGIAGAFIVSWEKVSDAAAGVAIASSIVMPTTVTGIGITLGNIDIVQGSLLLFLTNVGAIVWTGILVFLFLGHHQHADKKSTEILTVGLVGSGLMLLCIAIPLTNTLLGIMETNATRTSAKMLLEERLGDMHSSIRADSITTREVRVGTGSRLQVSAVLRGDTQLRLPYADLRRLEQELGESLGKQVQLDLRLLPPVTTLTEDLVAREERLALEKRLHQTIATFIASLDRRLSIDALTLAGSSPLQVSLTIKAPSQTVITNADRVQLREILEKELLRSVRLEMSVLRADVLTDSLAPERDDTLSALETAVDLFAARMGGNDGIRIAERTAEKTPTGYVLRVHLRIREDLRGADLYIQSLRNTLLSDFPAQSLPLRLEVSREFYTSL